jgi:uncharacterized membrane protein YfhO
LDDYRKLGVESKDVALLRSFVIENSERSDYEDFIRLDLTKLPGHNEDRYTLQEYHSDIHNLRRDSLTLQEHDQNHLKGKIQLNRKKLLFFSIPYDPGWKVKIDGQETDVARVNIGFLGVIIERGEHTVELEYFPRHVASGAVVSVLAFLLYGFCLLSRSIRSVCSRRKH